MLRAENISKSYNRHFIFKGINLSVEKGKTACIVGKNGSGKSTFLRILSTISKPDSGVIFIDNMDLSKDKKFAKKSIGFVPQDDAVLEDLTVWDNLMFFAGLYGVNKKHIFNEGSISCLLGLKEIKKKKIKELSGGQRKRVHFCCSILHNPEVLIMDEPFTGLDLSVKNDVLSYLNMLKSNGKTLIYTSHGTDEMYALYDSVYVIRQNGLSDITNEIRQIHLKNDELKQLVVQLIEQ